MLTHNFVHLHFGSTVCLSLTPLLYKAPVLTVQYVFNWATGDAIVSKSILTVFSPLSSHPETSGGSAQACRTCRTSWACRASRASRASSLRAGLDPGDGSQQGPVVL